MSSFILFLLFSAETTDKKIVDTRPQTWLVGQGANTLNQSGTAHYSLHVAADCN